MDVGQLTALALTALVVGSGATAAVAAQGTGPLSTALGPQQASTDEVVRDGNINITVAGNVAAGNTVTLTATLDGEPVPHAPVEIDGERVGTTDANGTVDVSVPDADEFEVEVEPDFEGSVTVPLAEEDDADDESDVDEETAETDEGGLDLAVDGNVSAGETVTVTATRNGTPVAGADVSVNGDHVGTTDANGTDDVVVPEGDEFEVEVEYEPTGKLKVPLAEAEDDDEGDEREDDEERIDLIVDGTLEPDESLSVTAMRDGSPVSNATVTVNGDTVGETDANGSITVEVPDADELEIEVATDEAEAEMTVDFEDAEDDHDADDEADEETEDDDAEDEQEDEA